MTSPHAGFAGGPTLVPGELRGYRRFRLADDGLHPTVHDVGGPWSGALERAVCAAGQEHAAPARDCGCGLYGWYSVADAGTISGYGGVLAVVAARGRTVLGDRGFRAGAARVEAVALPLLGMLPGRRRRAARMLAVRYPGAAVHRSRRSLLRAHPPPDLTGLGIDARPGRAGRYRLLALAVWLGGVLAFAALVGLPRGAAQDAPTAVTVGAVLMFALWQGVLVRLTVRCLDDLSGSSTRVRTRHRQ